MIDELGKLCRAIAPNEGRCPLKLSVAPQAEATIPGAVWSKVFTEQEAVDEKHLPTLVQLLVQAIRVMSTGIGSLR